MSKREADTQMTKDSSSLSGGGTWGSADAQRANASTMAARKLAKPRGMRRAPGGNRPAFGLGATSAAMRQQQQQQQSSSFPQFGQSEGGTSNSFGSTSSSFSFGQENKTDVPKQPSQSFPTFQFTGSSANSNTENAFASSGNMFNFNPPQASNPFSSSSSNKPISTSGVSHHGSIFNFESPAKPVKDLNHPPTDPNGNGIPKFLPGAPEIPKNLFSQDTPKPASQGFTWPPAQPQSASNNTPFSNPNAQEQQQADTNKGQKAPVNIFGGIQSPMAKDAQNSSPQDKPDGSTSQPAEPKTPFNPFASLKLPPSSSTPTTNLFGNLNKPSTSTFGATPESKTQTSPNLFSPEAMQTSPDNTPQVTQVGGSSAPPEHADTGAQANQTSASPVNPNLFGKTTAADPAAREASAKSVEENAQTTNTSVGTGGLFDRVSQPSSGTPFKFVPTEAPSVTQSGSTNNAPAPMSTTSNLFGAISSPATKSNATDNPTASKSTASNLFGTISSPATKPASTDKSAAHKATTSNLFGAFSSPVQATQSAPAKNPFASLPIPPKTHDKAASASIPSTSDSPKATVTNVSKAPTTNSAHTSTGLAIGASSTDFLDFIDLPELPPHLTQEDRAQVTIAWRLKQLDTSFRSYSEKIKDQALLASLHQFYNDCRKNVLAAGVNPVPNPRPGKRSSSAIANQNSSPSKRARLDDLSTTTASTAPGQGQAPRKTDIPQTPGQSSGKRKADEDLPRENEAGAAEEKAKRARLPESTARSQTSNLFTSIVGPEQARESSSQQSQSETSAAPAPTSVSEPSAPHNPFASMLSGPPATATSSSTQGSTFGGFPPVPGDKVLGKGAAGSPEASVPAPEANKSAMAAAASADSSATTAPSKPVTQSATPSSGPGSFAFKPPSFNVDASTDFMAQFGQAARQNAEAAKKKRKAEEYDSDEDDEAEWEKKDAEAQAQKKQKIEEAAKAAKPFIPQVAPVAKDKPVQNDKPKSIFDQIHPAFGLPSTQNIFGHLSGSNSAIGAQNGNESAGDGDKTAAEASGDNSSTKQPASRSLFDRVSQPEQATPGEDKTDDHTWKADSPIKFGATSASTSVPAVNVTSDSTPKATEGNFLFGNVGTPSAASSGLRANLFGNLTPHKSSGSAVGFGFAPPKGQANALAQASQDVSRATSPGATTADSAAESAAENQDETTRPQEQLDLMAQRVGEEDEDVLHEVRAKAFKFDMKEKQHVSKGIGPFRVLKHRSTKQRRVVMRVDPSGSVIINSGILEGARYESTGKSTVKATFTDFNGQLSLWQIKVKDNQLASKLAEVLSQIDDEAS